MKHLLKNSWFLILILIIIAPFVFTILFTLPANDDYSMAVKTFELEGNIFAKAIQQANIQYLTWGGGWPFNFLQIILNPLLLAGPTSYFCGIELVLMFLAFVVAFYYLLKVILKYAFNLKSYSIIGLIFACSLFAFLNTSVYFEVFYWFVGNSYLWELVFVLLNQILIILYFRKGFKKIYFYLLIIIGFISCFAYQIAVFSGVLYLFELFFFYKNNGSKTFNSRNLIHIIPLLVMILGGVISCFSPGNFVRQIVAEAATRGESLDPLYVYQHMSEYRSNFHFAPAIYYSAVNTFKIYLDLFKKPLLLIAFCVVFVIGLFIKDAKNLRINPVILLIFQVLTVYLSCFPVALGYSNGACPNRVCFIIDFFIVLYLSLFFLNLGVLIRPLFTNNKLFIAKTAMISILFLCMAFCVYWTDNNGSSYFQKSCWMQTYHLVNGCISNRSETIKTVEYIMNSPEEDVVIDSKEYLVNRMLGLQVPFTVYDNPDIWINKDVAKYFNKRSVRTI